MPWQVNGPKPTGGYLAEVRGITLTGATPRIVIDKWARLLESWDERLGPNWAEEAWQALARSHPKHIKPAPQKPSRPMVGITSALSFLRFMAKRVSDKSLVPPEEARRRAAICSVCPQAASIGGCSICKDALQLTIHPPEELAIPAACGACGCVLALKAWAPRHQLGGAEEFPYDASCWMYEKETE